jgi:hypothetical protein
MNDKRATGNQAPESVLLKDVTLNELEAGARRTLRSRSVYQ